MTKTEIGLLCLQVIVSAYFFVWNYLISNRLEDAEETKIELRRYKKSNEILMEFVSRLSDREKERWFNDMESKGWNINYYISPDDNVKCKVSVEKDGVEVRYNNQIV